MLDRTVFMSEKLVKRNFYIRFRRNSVLQRERKFSFIASVCKKRPENIVPQSGCTVFMLVCFSYMADTCLGTFLLKSWMKTFLNKAEIQNGSMF